MTLGFVFPGQGSQSVGMLSALADAEPVVSETFAEASATLGYDLWQLCQQGPSDRLNATEQTQPAMLAAGVAVWRVWRARGGPEPALAAGHSLGEYSALVAAGVLDFTTATALVRSRGNFMQQAVPEGQGAIAAVLGLDDAVVTEVCDALSAADRAHVVSAVNYNAPGQVVIAGHARAVDDALARLRERGARKAVPLPMSVPVHCALMRSAADRLLPLLQQSTFSAPGFPVLHNADLATHDDAQGIVNALHAQLFTPVRWAHTVTALRDRGVDVLVECGPGRVLAGLAKRIDRDLRCLPVYDVPTLEAALAELGRAA